MFYLLRWYRTVVGMRGIEEPQPEPTESPPPQSRCSVATHGRRDIYLVLEDGMVLTIIAHVSCCIYRQVAVIGLFKPWICCGTRSRPYESLLLALLMVAKMC
jgi:hypothetical protein